MNKLALAQALVPIADELDERGFEEELAELDEIIEQLAAEAKAEAGMTKEAQGQYTFDPKVLNNIDPTILGGLDRNVSVQNKTLPAAKMQWRQRGDDIVADIAGMKDFPIPRQGETKPDYYLRIMGDPAAKEKLLASPNASFLGLTPGGRGDLGGAIENVWNMAQRTQMKPGGQVPTAGTTNATGTTPAAGTTPATNVAIPSDYNALDREIDATRKKLLALQTAKEKLLSGKKGYTGQGAYEQMLQPVKQQRYNQPAA